MSSVDKSLARVMAMQTKPFYKYGRLYCRKITVQRSRAGREHDYDFALLELSDDIDLTGTSKARAIPLSTAADLNFDNHTKFTVSGWGWSLGRRGLRKPTRLQFASLPWVSEATCKEKYQAHITQRMICAGDVLKGGIDACIGDSGGKL